MSTKDLIRALKDEDYRLSMGVNVENPVGAVELTDADLGGVSGADDILSTFPRCTCPWSVGCTIWRICKPSYKVVC
jgi:mersacidin/lichenicidin family type 2 lantibiotic